MTNELIYVDETTKPRKRRGQRKGKSQDDLAFYDIVDDPSEVIIDLDQGGHLSSASDAEWGGLFSDRPNELWRELAQEAGETWRFVLELKKFEKNVALVGYFEHRNDPTRRIKPLDLQRLREASGSQVRALAGGNLRLTAVQKRALGILAKQPEIMVLNKDVEVFLDKLFGLGGADDIRFQNAGGWRRVVHEPLVVIRFREETLTAKRIKGDLSFIYPGGHSFALESTRSGWMDAPQSVVYCRHRDAESKVVATLEERGFLSQSSKRGVAIEIDHLELEAFLHAALSESWEVELESSRLQISTAKKISIERSGQDWFDLGGRVVYGEQWVALPQLLAAIGRGERFVRLIDQRLGVIPSDVAAVLKVAGKLGRETKERGVRFSHAQAGLVSGLLEEFSGITVDPTFAKIRNRLKDFKSIEARAEPDGFCGKLRSYQKEGLGWLKFLQDFGFGGCLADDMGLGKTIQVLAMLCERSAVKKTGYALLIAPKSLVANWQAEAAKFCPGLSVVDYTGPTRTSLKADPDRYTLVLTTYGIVRHDPQSFSDLEFDYLILDEAQAIKNAQSMTSQAVRELRGTHRLALSGTPIENHLKELWSLFEFMNPGFFGSLSAFRKFSAESQQMTDETLGLLNKAIRPFVLRRRKEQVLDELPDKSEQLLYCHMKPAHQSVYKQLHQHYHKLLTKSVELKGIAETKLEILASLLRLRQAACHPRLVDPDYDGSDHGKVDVLMAKLRELHALGRKTLVFSQFTSLLAILRERLEKQAMPYLYLDGQTSSANRRQAVVDFQSENGAGIFLLSLKAGGVGLNLTAAQYVFILDPWWNPAVEAQAIDRAHRMGQKQKVHAYRLVTKETVEEKILTLQDKKRQLADAIIDGKQGPVSSLSAEDLAFIFS